MPQSTVTKIESTGRSFEAHGKQMYCFQVTLENGIEGEAVSTHQDSPPYKAGDDVEYTLNQTEYGNKLKIKKVQEDGQPYKPHPKKYDGPKARSPEDILSATLCHYVQSAVSLEMKRAEREGVCDWKNVVKNFVNIHKAKELALKEIMNPQKKPAPAPVQEEEDEEDPF